MISYLMNVQGVPQLREDERQRFYTAFHVPAEEATAFEEAQAAPEATREDNALPPQKRQRTTKVKVPHPLSKPSQEPSLEVYRLGPGEWQLVSSQSKMVGIPAQEECDVEDPAADIKGEEAAEAKGDADEENEDPLAGLTCPFFVQSSASW